MKVLFISLGCDKNLVDSEKMLGILEERGHTFTDSEEEAEAIVINTCCFIGDAKEESVNTILEMARYRREGGAKALVVTGCLGERYRQEILDEIEEVDAVLGTASYDAVADAIDRAAAGERFVQTDSLERLVPGGGRRILTTGGHYAYLKIAEGCGKGCTYCIIPKVRGRFRSVPMEELVEEAEELCRGGVKELILVAQETTLYGTDLYGEKMLHELVRRLAKIPELRWIRILYCYPEEIYDGLIQVMKEEEKVCHYLDLPIQHISDRILRLMGRRTTKAQLERMIGKLREEIPDIALRTTLIAGFPTETEEEHEELMEFIDQMEFDRLGVFAYSPEEDTRAAQMEGQIPEEVKERRRDELMELQQEIAFDKGGGVVGRELLVMVEGQVSGENAYVARTYKDAPNVDGYLFLQTDEVLVSGDFVRAKVTKALEYDLIGEMVYADESAE